MICGSTPQAEIYLFILQMEHPPIGLNRLVLKERQVLMEQVVLLVQQVPMALMVQRGADGATGPQGVTGATGPVGDYVISVNGQTGAVEYIVDFKRGWFLS